MAVHKTPSGLLNTYDEGETPARGSLTLPGDGINNNPIVVDLALFTQHNADGTHKSNIIDKANLKTTVADGSTIEKDSTDGLRIIDAGVTAAKLATDAVETLKIKDVNVTAAKLATDAVETAKIKDANVTAAKLATDAVETLKIKDANVTAAKLATDAVETLKIKDANVTAAKLATDAVETAKILDSAVTAAKLEQKIYKAYANQAGTGAPTVQIVKNTLGATPTPSWYSTGEYRLYSAGLFPDKTKVFLLHSGGGNTSAVIAMSWIDASTISIHTKNSSFADADSLLSDIYIFIEIYP